MRVNKRQRRRYRKWAKEYIDKAEASESETPDKAAQARKIADMFARLGSPPHSRRRRKKTNQAAR